MKCGTVWRMLAVFLTGLALSAGSVAQVPPPPQAGGAEQHPPMPAPTNLQVLPKDIPTPELMRIMRGFASSLGVQCVFCHEVPKFAADTKPEKRTARLMMTMTNEINRKYLSQLTGTEHEHAEANSGGGSSGGLGAAGAAPNAPAGAAVNAGERGKTSDAMGEVSCGTCHRGHSMPLPYTPQERQNQGPGEPPPPPPNPQP